MHICHVNLATGFSGGESQTLLLIKQQLSENYELTVVANPKSPLVEKLQGLNVNIILTSHFTLKHQRAITASCKLIHVHEGRAIYWAWLQFMLHGIPYIVTRRIDNPIKNKLLSRLAYSKASVLIGLSNAIVEQLKYRFEAADIEKIPSSPVDYPVDINKVTEIKSHFENKFIILQASNLLTHKGHDTTLDVAQKLEKSNPNIHFVILGDGPEKNRLLARSELLSNVTFIGKKSDMGNWFAAAELFIHPSLNEGLGSVLLEAIKAGLVVIGSNVGGIPDIIEHGKSGFLFTAKDANTLTELIKSIAEDDLLKMTLLEGGKDKLKKFEIAYTSLKYKEVYLKIIQKDNKRR
jgi:L-malate glycosyltransferase